MLFLSWVDPSAKTTNIRLNYVSMDSNYSGKLLPVYGYSFTPEYQGFFTLPIQNQTTGQAKFMDVTDPDNPIELTNGDSKDSLTGQVGDSMVLTIPQQQLNDYLDTDEYELDDNNPNVDVNSKTINPRKFAVQTTDNVITINLVQSQKADLKFVDQDTSGYDSDNPYNSPVINVTGITTTYAATGKPEAVISFGKGTPIADAISALNKKGYELVSNNFGDSTKFDTDSKNDQHFVVIMKHATRQLNDNHTVHETIHYQYENGDMAEPDYIAEASFNWTGTYDDVTKQTTWNYPTEGQTFDKVSSPTIKGYTPDQASIPQVTVKYNSDNIVKTVIYKADNQTAKITYIDDTDNQPLSTDNASGKFDTVITFLPDVLNKINDYERQGYRLVSNNFDNQTYQANNGDNAFTVHLAHNIVNVSDTDTVNEIIHYVYTDGSQAAPDYLAHVTWIRSGKQDMTKTGEKDRGIIWDKTELQTLPVVDSPQISGYVADQGSIPAQTVNFGDKDIVKTVTYHAGDQKATITYIDQATGKTLKIISQKENADTPIQYLSKNDLQGYFDDGYQLVKDGNGYDPKGVAPNFDDNSNVDQNFNIYLEHTYQTINPSHPGNPGKPINNNPNGVKYQSGTDAKSLTINGTQTIIYTGLPKDKQLANDTSQHVRFTHEIVIDKVTGQTVEDHGWTGPQTYQTVKTPEVAGYIPDKTVSGGETVTYQNPDSQDIVHFTPVNDTQKATIIYVDQNTGDHVKTVTESGKSNSVIDYYSASDLQKLSDQGYQLVNNGYDPDNQVPSFDDSSDIDQTFYITLTHKQTPQSQPYHVTETIRYVYADGKKAHDEFTATKNFTRNGVKDEVTGQTKWEPVPSQQFTSVVSPEITGYTPDQEIIPAITVNYNDGNVIKTVVYRQGEQTATISYIDDKTGNTMMVDNATGKFNNQIKFANNVDNQVKTFEGQGYKFVSNNFNNQTYQADNAKNTFEVHFTHGQKDVSREDQITETINYVYTDGRQAHDHNVAQVTITQRGQQDLVTKAITWQPTTARQFKAVESPTIKGYVPDITEIPAINVNFGHDDITRTVTYRNNQQAARIIYVDDNTGDDLKMVNKQGASDAVILYASKDDLAGLQKQGYVLVSNGYDPDGKAPVFDADTSLDQTFYIHLAHGTQETTRDDTINETIHYIYAGGKKAHDDVIAEKTFTQNGTKDLVTGDITWRPVTSQQFASVKSPTISGYTPDYTVVPAVTVNYGDPDINTTVTYTAGQQVATIVYVDRTTGQTLNTLMEHGASDTTIPYQSANDLKTYEGQGYVLDDNQYDPTTTPKFDDDSNIDQTYYIYLKHGTKNVSETPTVHETIHYVYADGTTAAKDVTAQKQFSRQWTEDLVTKQITWQPVASQQFASVKSPTITGYTPDQLSIPAIMVNYNDGDVVRRVTYTPAELQATIKYIDDNTGAVLQTDNGTGKYQDPIKFANDVNTQIKDYEGQGYTLVSNNFAGQKYQADNAKNTF